MIKANHIPEEIRDFLDYQPETGVVVWKKKPSRKVVPGNEVTTTDRYGYRQVMFKRTLYRLHRVIWFLYYGEQPGDRVIDHINGLKGDNRISNLRLVSRQVNQHNRKAFGISYVKGTGKWSAQIYLDDKRHFLGYHTCPLMAGLAYQEAKKLLHPTAPL
jgi:hypothetical protein